MQLDRFHTYVASLRGGCKNRLDDGDEVESYYLNSYNELTGTLMSITAQHYNNDEEN